MKKVAVQAMVPAKDDKPQLGPVTVEVNWAENLEEAKKMYGEEAVLSNAFANWRITLQAAIRNALKKGLSEAEIRAKLANAKMGVALEREKVDPEAAFRAKFMSASPEERKKLLAELHALASKA